MTWDFMRSRYGPKITVEVWKVSGPTRDFQVVWAGLARGVVDALGLDVGSLGRVDTPLGMRTGLRLSFQEGFPDTWKQYLRVDWGDEGPAETWLANINILGLSFYGWLVRYGLNDALIDPSVNVFGPNTVDPGLTTTGEKTLLTMSTTLPAGGKNVIIAVLGKNSAFSAAGSAVLRIYKGTTLLYQEFIQFYANSGDTIPRHITIMAVDGSPSGNDTYSFKMNVITASSSSGLFHVQAIVIKTTDAVWGYNITAVNISSGSTATVTSISTTFPSGSKVALIAVAYGSYSGSGYRLIGAENVKLKSGTTVISSNQFNQGSYDAYDPFWVVLAYLDIPTSSSQSYSVEITNGSSATFSCYAEIVAFTVSDGAFLDTSSVSLSIGTQVTVASQSTVLTGDVVAIGLAAAVNTGTAGVTAFNANDVTLQLNNSTTDSVNNLTKWYISQTGASGMSAILPLFRFDTGVSNPSYQIKMTARQSGINGEAKILVFVPKSGQTFTVRLAETLTASDSLMRLQTLARTMAETLTASDTLARTINYIRLLAETITASDTLARQKLLARIISETLTASDTVNRIPTFVRTLSEAMTASDSLTRTAAYVRTIAEAVGISSTAFTGAAIIALAETILIAESLQAIRIPFQPTPPTGPSGPPAEIPLPTPQQVFPIGLAVALGVVFAGAVYGVQRRRSMGAVMGRATQRRPRLRGFRLGMRRWKAGKMPRKRRWRDSLGE
jgi:hypothetical protein